MKLIEFPEMTTTYAKSQPPYKPLPAYRQPEDPDGRIICKWKLTIGERIRLLFSGVIWHSVLTFNDPLQPQLLFLKYPFQATGPKVPWWKRGPDGWPIETYVDKPVKSFVRLLVQNFRKFSRL
jgi:hypothetical protein